MRGMRRPLPAWPPSSSACSWWRSACRLASMPATPSTRRATLPHDCSPPWPAGAPTCSGRATGGGGYRSWLRRLARSPVGWCTTCVLAADSRAASRRPAPRPPRRCRSRGGCPPTPHRCDSAPIRARASATRKLIGVVGEHPVHAEVVEELLHFCPDGRERPRVRRAKRPRMHDQLCVVRPFHQFWPRGDDRLVGTKAGGPCRHLADLFRRIDAWCGCRIDEPDPRHARQLLRQRLHRDVIERLNHEARWLRFEQAFPGEHLREKLLRPDATLPIERRILQFRIQTRTSADRVDGFLERRDAGAREFRGEPRPRIELFDFRQREVV